MHNFKAQIIGAVVFTCTLAMVPLVADAQDSHTSAVNGWNVRGNIPVGKFIIQSHRGAGELAPENTLEAFELGWKLGTWPESDLRTTKDGVIVAFHDANFERTVKDCPPALRKKGVKDITYAELLKLDVGGWKGEQFSGRKVSKISDVFKLMRGNPERRLYLDIKNVDLKQLANEVRENDVTKQIIFTTTKYDMIRDWKKLVPESQTLNWMGGTQEELTKRLEEVRAAKFEGITQLQLHVRFNTNNPSVEPFNLSRQFLRDTGNELRKHGVIFQSLPWEANQAETYWELLDCGVMAFATDHPEVVLKAVRDYYAKPAAKRPVD